MPGVNDPSRQSCGGRATTGLFAWKSPWGEECCAVCAYFGRVGQRVLLLLWSLSSVHRTELVFLSLPGADFFPISFYIMSYTQLCIRGPSLAAVPCRGSGFAPGGEMKVSWGLLLDVGHAGAGFLCFWKGPFPVASEKGLF